MNYEEMSDFEIKHAVAKIVLRARRDCEEIYCNQVTGGCRWADGANWHNFDPLSNPSDAMPILIEMKIGFKWVNGSCTASSVLRGYHESTSDNPLRAAMIVFLMMQDEAK